MNELTDEELIELCKEGDKLAFEVLIKRYHSPIYNYIYSFTNNKELSEDITQETFIKMVNNIEKYRSIFGTKFSTWLFKIARNNITDEFRKTKEYISIDKDDGIELISPDNIENGIIQNDEIDRVNEVVNSLDKDTKSMIYLKYNMNFSYKEIAKILSYTPEKVKWRLHDTIEKIRKIIKLKEVNQNE